MSRGWVVAAAAFAFVTGVWAQGEPPAGYDDPGSDQGGPRLQGGPGWIEEVWPRTISFAEDFAGGTPTVMFLTNYGGVDTVHELARRLPMDVVHLHAPSGNKFTSRGRLRGWPGPDLVADVRAHQLRELAKLIITRYGGHRAFMRASPFALGMVLGEFIIGSLWCIIGIALGISTYSFWV